MNEKHKETLKCPKCGREWVSPCEQTVFIELFGECIVCRFLPVSGGLNQLGSGVGTDEEIEEIAGINKETSNHEDLE